MEEKVIPYLGNEKYIFISYAHKDKNRVYSLIKTLQSKFNVWFDNGIHFTNEWRKDIIDHIDGCALFVYVITEASLASPNCQNEINYAAENGIPFLNILMDNIELPKEFRFSFGRYQMCKYFEYHNDNEFINDILYRTPSIQEIVKGEQEKEELSFSSIKFERVNFYGDTRFPIGEDNNGKLLYEDYTTFPNALILGPSGSGKSNFALNIICSLCKINFGFQQQFIIFDSIGYTYAIISKIAHLKMPIITDLKGTKNALSFLEKEIENRLTLLNDNRCPTINEYNAAHQIDRIAHIAVIIDEYHDFAIRDKNFHDRLANICSSATKVGIHFFLVDSKFDSISSTIKDFCPTIFASGNDTLKELNINNISIDCFGEAVMNKGEQTVKVLTPHLELKDIKKVAEECTVGLVDDDYAKYLSVIHWLKTKDYVSMSMIQRELGFGFNRANRIMNRILEEGLVEKDRDNLGRGYKVKK